MASGGLTSRGLQNPTFGTSENIRHYRIPIELEKTKFRGWQAARNGEKFQGHVFNSKIRSQKNTEETQGCIERNKTLLRRFLSFFDVRDELRHSRSTASIVRRRSRPSRRCRGRSPPRGAPGRGCPWWRRLAGSRC